MGLIQTGLYLIGGASGSMQYIQNGSGTTPESLTNVSQIETVRDLIPSTGIDLTTGASTLIGKTSDSNGKFIPEEIVIKVTAIGTTIITPPALSIGTNPTDYDNILPITTLTGLDTVDTFYRIPITNISPIIDKNTNVYVKVTRPSILTGDFTDLS